MPAGGSEGKEGVAARHVYSLKKSGVAREVTAPQ
jgi:hypothetical protein